MTGQEALTLVDTLLHSANQGQRLTDVQSAVFLGTWDGHSYQEITEQLNDRCQYEYIKQVGSHLWRSLSQTIGEPVSKRNVVGVTFSPDGKRLATSDTKGEIQIWDTCTGEQLIRCRGHQHWTWAVAFSPDGQYLASASDDYLVKLWEVETGQCLKTFTGHTYSVNAVTFSPDGQIIASCGQDATIRLWQVAHEGEKTSPPTPLLLGYCWRMGGETPCRGKSNEQEDTKS